MKKQNFLTILLSASIILSSCATAIKAPPVEAIKIKTELDATPQMDFIGFKIDSTILSSTPKSNIVFSEFEQAKAIRDTKSLRTLGNTLEKAHIAQDKSFAYFGIYSLQEMEAYKSNNRYVTFIEVAQNDFLWDDNSYTKEKLTKGAIGLISSGAIFTIGGITFKNVSPNEEDEKKAEAARKTFNTVGDAYIGIGISSGIIGAVLACVASTPTKSDIFFNGTYNIYIYDSKTKEILRKEPVNVHIFNTLSGSYDYDQESKNSVNEYISANVSNAILKKYQELNRWLKSLK